MMRKKLVYTFRTQTHTHMHIQIIYIDIYIVYAFFSNVAFVFFYNFVHFDLRIIFSLSRKILFRMWDDRRIGHASMNINKRQTDMLNLRFTHFWPFVSCVYFVFFREAKNAVETEFSNKNIHLFVRYAVQWMSFWLILDV